MEEHVKYRGGDVQLIVSIIITLITGIVGLGNYLEMTTLLVDIVALEFERWFCGYTLSWLCLKLDQGYIVKVKHGSYGNWHGN